MSERRVEIKNFANGNVVYKIPGRNVRREFLPGMKMKVSYEELEQGLCDYGIKQLFLCGALACTNPQDAIDLQLAEAPALDTLATADEIKKTLIGGDASKIYLLMKNASRETQDTIINIIVANRIYDSNIVKWCKEFFNYNPLPALEKTEVE